MKIATFSLLALLSLAAAAQQPAPVSDPWQTLSFLIGTWDARTAGGSAAQVVGTYTFQMELKGHVLARHAVASDCKGPQDFDCQHADMLYVYQDSSGTGFKAIYFDNEGHVIHYAVTTPGPSTVIFLSEPNPGPRFRLVYRLDGGVMEGKFQSQAPAGNAWVSYLEWSGGRH